MLTFLGLPTPSKLLFRELAVGSVVVRPTEPCAIALVHYVPLPVQYLLFRRPRRALFSLGLLLYRSLGTLQNL